MSKRGNHPEIRAGISLTLVFFISMGALFIYGKTSRAWRLNRELNVVFNNLGNLRKEAVVRYNGLDIGKVRQTKIIMLSDDVLKKFPVLTKAHLERLPLSDEDRAWLQGVADDRIDAEIRKRIKDRTMVALTLEVLEGDQAQRYREDDQIRIGGTIMGESVVEIVSGSRKTLEANYDRYQIGASGDMYSNLAESMSQVGEIMSSLTEMVGAGDADSPMAARLANFDGFTQRLEGMAASFDQRFADAWDLLDTNMEVAETRMDGAEKAIANVKPELLAVLTQAQESLKEVQTKVQGATSDGHEQIKSLRARALKELANLHGMIKDKKERVPLLISRMYEWSEKMREQVATIDRVMTRSDRALTQSTESARQSLQGMRATFDGLEQKLWFLTNYPSMGLNLPRGAKGFVFFNKWRHALLAKHYRELRGELEKARLNLKAEDASDQVRINNINQILTSMDQYLLQLEAETPKRRRRRKRR